MLVCKEGKVDYKADGYQEIIKQTAEGQILYQINSANVRNSELKSDSVNDFLAALEEIKANERKNLVSTDVVAYASPDGKEDQNAKLSDNRSKSAEKAFNKVTKKNPVEGPVNVQSIGVWTFAIEVLVDITAMVHPIGYAPGGDGCFAGCGIHG